MYISIYTVFKNFRQNSCCLFSNFFDDKIKCGAGTDVKLWAASIDGLCVVAFFFFWCVFCFLLLPQGTASFYNT
jgi:hypothetical protein